MRRSVLSLVGTLSFDKVHHYSHYNYNDGDYYYCYYVSTGFNWVRPVLECLG